MGAQGIWLGNASWPSNRSCGQFAKDVFRIAGAKTDKEKALAFYDWYTRCMMRGANLMTPDGAGGYSRCYDPLPTLTSWGHGECTFWGWVAAECLKKAGASLDVPLVLRTATDDGWVLLAAGTLMIATWVAPVRDT
ncbi:hypothetical protein LCGC14_1690030, partial [marine sediment metagenome]